MRSEKASLLRFEEVSFSYSLPQALLQKISFSLGKGEVLAILGRSGSGKTTLLRLAMALEKVDEGRIEYAEGVSEGMAYLRQNPLLLPWRTAVENILLPFELAGDKGRDRASLEQEALVMLKNLGMEAKGELYPHELSGGMKQRLALARAMLLESSLLLLDEPFGALDLSTRERLYEQLLIEKEKRSMSMILVTHDFHDAFALADRILVLSSKGFCLELHSPFDKDFHSKLLRSALLLP